MTKQEILEAAAQIFSEKGYHAASMQDIANIVNLQKASLYHHISGKQEILFELLDQALDVLIQRIEGVLTLQKTSEEKLRLAMRVYIKTLVDQRDLSAVLLFEHRSLNESYRSRHLPKRDEFEQLWRRMIEDGILEKSFNFPDPALAARALLGLMNWTISWYKVEGLLSGEDIADLYADLILFGLLKRQ
jgi:AcrR family transcriptional regulator